MHRQNGFSLRQMLEDSIRVNFHMSCEELCRIFLKEKNMLQAAKSSTKYMFLSKYRYLERKKRIWQRLLPNKLEFTETPLSFPPKRKHSQTLKLKISLCINNVANCLITTNSHNTNTIHKQIQYKLDLYLSNLSTYVRVCMYCIY